jgi:hypothetical protein
MENQDYNNDLDLDYDSASDDSDSLHNYNIAMNENNSNIHCTRCHKSFPLAHFLPNSKSARRDIILELWIQMLSYRKDVCHVNSKTKTKCENKNVDTSKMRKILIQHSSRLCC